MASDYSSAELAGIRETLARRLGEPHVSPLVAFTDDVAEERGLPRGALPYPDPDGGGVHAQVLVLLAAPSPPARKETGGSGLLTIDNDDRISGRQRGAVRAAGLPRAKTVSWNAVPWPADDAAPHCVAGARSLIALIGLLDDLRVVVTLGSIARDVWSIAGEWSPRAGAIPTVHAGLRASDHDLHVAFRKAVEIIG